MTGGIHLAVDNGPAPIGATRRAQLAAIHVGRKNLGMAEDDYRAVLERLTGHRSAKDCDGAQLNAVIAEMRRLGFEPSPATPSRAPAGGGVARKARAMWISLHQLGAIEDASERALEAFGQRQLGVERLQWANEREGFRLIEALKAMAERHGWDQRLPSRIASAERVRTLKDRLVAAQLGKLTAAGEIVRGPLAADRSDWSSKRLERASAELAIRIRELPPTT